MFTVDDIREIAIQIEKNGEQAYRQAASTSQDPLIGEIFIWMADEERRHGEWFAAITSDKELTDEDLEMERMGRALLQEMVAGQTFSLEQEQLGEVRTFAEMLAQSRSFEQDTILFYEFLKGVIDDPETQSQLDVIIAEERRHHEQLGELKNAGGGPVRNLAIA